jgi:hypothetical protein
MKNKGACLRLEGCFTMGSSYLLRGCYIRPHQQCWTLPPLHDVFYVYGFQHQRTLILISLAIILLG